jgi:Family of unknown function (DUF6481)
MSGFKSKGFSDRLNHAASAKKAALEKFRARPAMDDPAVVERREARLAASVAREARLAERAEARRADEARKAAEMAAAEAERIAREEREAIESAEREVALEAERKASRDARYAARKARK